MGNLLDDLLNNRIAPGSAVLSVADLAALRAVATSTLTANQGASVGSPGGIWVWSPTSGASFASDDHTVEKPNDVLLGSAGRWFLMSDSAVMPTFAAARLAVTGRQKSYQIQAGVALGDGAGGFFDVDPSDVTSADNGGTILVAGSVRLKRRFSDRFNVRWFGAIGDGSSDDTPAIAACIAARKSYGSGNIYLPRPPVAYTVQPQQPNFFADMAHGTEPGSGAEPFYAHACLTIDFDDVTIEGDPGGSLVRYRMFGGRAPATTYDLVQRDGNAAPWLAAHTYAVSDIVLSANGHNYVCTTAGTSGTTAPADISAATCGDVPAVGGTAHFALFDYVLKGGIFYVKSTAIGADPPRRNIRFRNLTCDGGAPREDNLWPITDASVAANTTTPHFTAGYDRPGIAFGGATVPAGSGWDPNHRPVIFAASKNYDNIIFEDCDFHSWRAEVFYASIGAPTPEGCRFYIRRVRISDYQSDGISVTAALDVEDVTIVHGFQAIECDPIAQPQTFRRVKIIDCVNGFTAPSNYSSYLGRSHNVVDDIVIQTAYGAGVYVTGYAANFTLRNMKLIDCGSTNLAYPSLWITSQFGANPTNIDVDGCDFVVDARNGLLAVGIGMSAPEVAHISRQNRIHNCRFYRTKNAIAMAFDFQSVIAGGMLNKSFFDIYDNYFDTNAYHYNLGTTPLNPSWMPLFRGNYTDTLDTLSMHQPVDTLPVLNVQSDTLITAPTVAGIFHVGGIDAAHARPGQILRVRGFSTTDRIAYFDGTTTGIKLDHDRPRFISARVELVLELNAAADTWVEKFYGPAHLTGNDHWLPTETATTVVPNLDPRGADTLTLAPVAAQTYTTPIRFAPGVRTRIVLNANATIQHNANIVLAGGANFAPTGSGGEIHLIYNGTKVYEMSRIQY